MKKYYIDNMKSFVVILVVLFHVVASFASNNSVLNYHAEGIAWFDAIGYLVYPWFMILMFIISGMTAHYSLKKRSPNMFMKERIKGILLPFIVYQLTIGALTSLFSFRVTNLLEKLSAEVPASVIHVIRILNGMGPSWYLLQLFITCFIFWVLLKIFKIDKFQEKCSRINMLGLILLVIPIFVSAQLAYIGFTFRFFLYTLSFILGYLVFASENVLAILAKYKIQLSVGAICLGILQMIIYWGQSFMSIVNEPLVMLFSWITVLAVIGIFYRSFSQTDKWKTFLSNNSYGIYLFHYLPLTIGAYLMDYYQIGLVTRYLLLTIFTFVCSLIMTMIIKRLPLISTLFGVK